MDVTNQAPNVEPIGRRDQPFLFERFPTLAATLPHTELGAASTPVRELNELAATSPGPAIWLKDDSRFGKRWGGNKARKLEWILADAEARNFRRILTFGALGTNHGLSTALHAKDLGIQTVLLLVDQPIDDHVKHNFELIQNSDAIIYRTHSHARTVATVPWAMLRHADLRQRKLPYFLPVGGSSPLGAVGFVEAGLELGAQVAAGALPEPSHVVLALGSNGSTAGLTLGLRLAGLTTRVVAVNVNDKTDTSVGAVATLARRSEQLLRERGAEFSPVEIHPEDLGVTDAFLGSGYGEPTKSGNAAIALARDRADLKLEPVYTGKAMAGLLAMRSNGQFGDGPVLFWNTNNAL